jgi:nucleotide-binding universal stress UspA family protein
MRVLLAIDGSKFSEAATQAVIRQSQPQGTEVKVLHVVDLALLIPTSYAAGFRAESLKNGEELVRQAEQALSKAGYKVQTAVEEGDPKSRIVEDAANWKADLIVIGSHGRRGVDRFLMGSVSEAVARHAPCSVQIVRIATETPRPGLTVSATEMRKDAEAPGRRVQTPTAAEPKRRRRVCTVCGKPSASNICQTCADKIRAEAVARKKREDKGEE